MKNFRSYVEESEKNEGAETQEQAASVEQLGKQIAAAYHGKSNADMWKTIVAEAEKSRRAGTLSDAEIDAFYQTFSPMLDASQRKKLQGIVEKLKNI